MTLLEVVVALAVGSLVILTARRVLDSTQSAAISAAHESQTSLNQADRRWTMRQLVGQIGATDSDTALVGNQDRAVFTTWCVTADGWEERCRASLQIHHGVSVDTIHLIGGGRKLTWAAAPTRLMYLRDARNGGTWTSAWAAPGTPLAIGLVTRSDTMIARIGTRG